MPGAGCDAQRAVPLPAERGAHLHHGHTHHQAGQGLISPHVTPYSDDHSMIYLIRLICSIHFSAERYKNIVLTTYLLTC
jgi:hypothetical protein